MNVKTLTFIPNFSCILYTFSELVYLNLHFFLKKKSSVLFNEEEALPLQKNGRCYRVETNKGKVHPGPEIGKLQSLSQPPPASCFCK